ncbi:MAG: hypothetical protein J3R72DRAFT_497898 [Linnemannia gamsii]|nr:MAG: hypothetical protein J3R72DRAFT_497898 [Linnemannia gamsii]
MRINTGSASHHEVVVYEFKNAGATRKDHMERSGAQNSVVKMYQNGRGMTKDLAVAKYWYLQAGLQGHAAAKKSSEVPQKQGIRPSKEPTMLWRGNNGTIANRLKSRFWWLNANTGTGPGVYPVDHNGFSPNTGEASTFADMAYITTYLDPSAGMEVMFWRDIRTMFIDAVYVRHNSRTLDFLKDVNGNTLALPTMNHRRLPPVTPHIIPRPPVLPAVQHAPRPTARSIMGSIAPHINLVLLQEKGEGEQKDVLKALESYLKAVKKGHAYAQFAVGKLYFEGKDVAQDYTKSMVWYLKAAELGLADAQDAIGTLYHNGHGVPKDDSRTLEWTLKAANQGFAPAIRGVGYCYHKGLGVIKDYSLAMQWYLRAADLGDTYAKVRIGQLYRGGHGVLQNYTRAMEWFLNAADQGCLEVFVHVGIMYEEGRGVLRDYSKAHEWYLKAAEQGYANAQYNIGVLYDLGHGVQQDRKKAMEWMMKAAVQGRAAAQVGVGNYYRFGLGVFKNLTLAMHWYSKAAEQGRVDAKNSLRALRVFGSKEFSR